MSEEQEAALLLKRAPGGMQSLNETNRLAIANVRDVQLERAQDLLRGILLYETLNDAAPPPGREKMAAK
jgi:hypothetical protein